MEDDQIIELYWERDESAIVQTQYKYGRFCFSIAYNILHNKEDSEECVNDTYIGAWNAMPPHRPDNLAAFLGKITRSVSLKKWRWNTALKRGGGGVDVILDELTDCVVSAQKENPIEQNLLTGIIDDFLRKLPDAERRVFVCRYWYFDDIKSIAKRFSFSQSKVKMMLKRTRDKLRVCLEKEGIWI